MIFSLLEDKGRCVGVFSSEEGLEFGGTIPISGLTWSYNSHLKDMPDIRYAKIAAPSPRIEDNVPESMGERLSQMAVSYKSHIRSLFNAKVDFNGQCMYDYIPMWFLLDYYSIRNEAIGYIWEKYGHGLNMEFHEHMVNVCSVAKEAAREPLKFDVVKLREYAYSGDAVCKEILDGRRKTVKYDPFRARTGRFATNEWSFPIHNFPISRRDAILPSNDVFVELDFNAVDIRTLIALNGGEQPWGDIHDWNVANVFCEPMERSEAKRRFFAWLYSDMSDSALSSVYAKHEVIEKHRIDGELCNPFGRKIETEGPKELSYLCQSTAADLTHDRAAAIIEALKYKKSRLVFTVYDSIVIDVAHDEIGDVADLCGVFSETKLGHFPVNISIGKNYGNMEKLEDVESIGAWKGW